MRGVGGQRPTTPPPTVPPQGSRTDPHVNATRAMPMSQASAPTGPPPVRPTQPPPTRPSARPSQRTFRRRRRVVGLLLVLVLLLAWPIGLLIWANGALQHTEALSGAANTPGTTYLLAGSDSRADGSLSDGEGGARTDTIMLLTQPASGTPSLISIPRDVVVEVPGHGAAKLNAAYTYGGPTALVASVENLTGITVDHYVEIGMAGVEAVVDAVGGVNLCWDADVDDPESGMVWTAGCHDVDGAAALAFARMRKSDPSGDIGRGQRQQQVIQAVVGKVANPSVLLPWRQLSLANVATDTLITDPGTGLYNLGRMALTFRAATGPGGFRGAPPIANADYRGSGLGSTVLLGDDAPVFWQQVLDGTLPTQAEQEAGETG